jgi:large conductance mechanosensitive channel
MGILKEFQEFAMKGNVVDLAVGVIMGAAFGPIVSTLVDNVIMPPIGLLLGGVDFSSYMAVLKADPDPAKAVAIKYGLFLNAIIKFLITAAAVFLLVKAMNEAKKRMDRSAAAAAAPAAPPPPPPSEVYLKEIRDLLAKK